MHAKIKCKGQATRLGRMVEQSRSGTYTQIVYAPSGAKLALMSGLSTLHKAYVPLPGGTMAVYNSSGLAYYRHADWVGSSRLASTPSRTVYFDGSYAPFGEAYANIGTLDLSFTGMNQDTVSNLYDFPGREYGIQGRWPSPDPAGLSAAFLKDPQTLNRYAYVRNSPLRLIDPEGYCPAPAQANNRTLKGWASNHICGSSASSLVLGSMAKGAVTGASEGAFAGFVGGELAGGLAGIPGAILGGFTGAVVGAAGAAIMSAFTAAACDAAGMYGS
jgi:RHS repeat-associated protein